MNQLARLCPLCQGVELNLFFSKPKVPLDVGMVWDSADKAKSAPTGQIDLAFCQTCGFVFNQAYIAGRVAYEPGFEASLHHSSSHRKYLEHTSQHLVERFALVRKKIIEVGCGSGFFLKMLCAAGPNEGLGIDPSILPTQGLDKKGPVRFLQNTFNPILPQSDRDCDFLCCRSVLEHIESPLAFLREVNDSLGERQVPIYFDLADGSAIFRSSLWWNVFYEQCAYFSEATLRFAFESSGFHVERVGQCFQGSYLCIEANSGAGPHTAGPPGISTAFRESLMAFADGYQSSLKTWTKKLNGWNERGQTAVVWGTGGRGVSFVNELPVQPVVKYMVDINPERQGKFASVAALQIVPPESLVQIDPDYIVITNPIYEPEIEKTVRQLGLNSELVLA